MKWPAAKPSELARSVLRSALSIAMDLTQEMLDACRRRTDQNRVDYQLADFRTDELGSDYDVIVASLSLHHLTTEERPGFFERACASLKPGGVLIAAEVIIDESPAVRAAQYQLWQAFMSDNGGLACWRCLP